MVILFLIVRWIQKKKDFKLNKKRKQKILQYSLMLFVVIFIPLNYDINLYLYSLWYFIILSAYSLGTLIVIFHFIFVTHF